MNPLLQEQDKKSFILSRFKEIVTTHDKLKLFSNAYILIIIVYQ